MPPTATCGGVCKIPTRAHWGHMFVVVYIYIYFHSNANTLTTAVHIDA